MDLIYIWYHDIYWSKAFISTISTHDSDSHTLRILKMLKFWFTFLRPYYFLTLSPNWFIFGLMNILHIAIPHPHPTLGHVKIKVTDLEFSRNKMCTIRQAILSGDRSCSQYGLFTIWYNHKFRYFIYPIMDNQALRIDDLSKNQNILYVYTFPLSIMMYHLFSINPLT